MPTVITHSLFSLALGKTIKWKQSTKVSLYSFCCGSLPDLDFIGRYFGIKYADQWGHRGWTHSLFMAVVIGLLLSILCSQKQLKYRLSWWLYFSFLTSTHTLLDMCTNGGHGVALFAPWSHTRIFFSQYCRVINVSPMHFHNFTWDRFTPVFLSELTWIILPVSCIIAVRYFFEARNN